MAESSILTLDEASAVVGVSPVHFLEMVRGRWMPAALPDPSGHPLWSRGWVEDAMAGDWSTPEPIRSSRIYVAGFADYIKIGFSRNVVVRIQQLEAGLPERLHVYAIHDGVLRDEVNLFRQFAEHRLRGEWFRKTPAIIAWIEAGCPLCKVEQKASLFRRKGRVVGGVTFPLPTAEVAR